MEVLDTFRNLLLQVNKLVKDTNKKSVLIIQQYPKELREEAVQFPPIRESLSNIICFVSVTGPELVGEIVTMSRNVIDLIVLDTDRKRQNTGDIIDAVNRAAQPIQIPVVSYSDYETWSIAAVNFMLQVEGKHTPEVLLIGKSQLASRIILDLISRNVRLFLLKEEFSDGVSLPYDNYTNISIAAERIVFVSASESRCFDALLSCSIMENTPFLSAIGSMEFKHIYDIGLNNFPRHFICERKLSGSVFYRSDDHAGIASMIVNILESEYLVKRNLSRVAISDISVVSGGLIGDEGDVVVDNADNPSAVFGVADGLGLFKKELTEKDRGNIERIQSLLK